MDKCQATMTIYGGMTNLVTAITLIRSGKEFPPTMVTLLIHQSLIDCAICTMGTIMLLQPQMWVPGNYYADIIICHVWDSQAIYWGGVAISIYNLVFLAYERFLAVCRPFKHVDFTPRKLFRLFLVLYICSQTLPVGLCLSVSYKDAQCVNKDIDRLLQVYSIAVFTLVYFVPCTFFFSFYGMVINSFRKRRTSDFSSSKVIDKATVELTKTAAVVTCVFIVCIGYDLIYYMFGCNYVVEYIINSPVQKVGVGLSSFNSVANPMIYGLLMPSYRKSLRMTFCKHR